MRSTLFPASILVLYPSRFPAVTMPTPTPDSVLKRTDLPRLELRLLLEQVTGLTRTQLITRGDQELTPEQLSRLEQLIAARLAGEPIAYLIGEREFFGRSFKVAPGVLIPRPETEHLIEAVFERCDRSAPLAAVDLGTGSGILAVTLALEAPAWNVSASDLSAAALAIAQSNAQALGATVQFFQGSWYQALPAGPRFDLIVSNPPYLAAGDRHLEEGDLRFEPRGALTDEADGLRCLRELTAGAPTWLKPGGWLMVEHGFDQGAPMRDLFRAAGLVEVATVRDLAGLERITLGQCPASHP
jgi:release factor glutamine methyltransferase